MQYNATPAELSDWESDVRSYAAMTGLVRGDLSMQHKAFRAFLDATLKSRTKYKVIGTTVLFGPNPDDVKAEQQPQQSALSYYTRLYETFMNADMEGLTIEGIFVMRLLAGMTDEKLLERLQKVTEKTRENLVAEMSLYEEEIQSRTEMASSRSAPRAGRVV